MKNDLLSGKKISSCMKCWINNYCCENTIWNKSDILPVFLADFLKVAYKKYNESTSFGKIKDYYSSV